MASLKRLLMMVIFPIGIGLERVGVIGPIRRSCVMGYLQKNNKKKVIRRGNAYRLSDA